MRWNSVQIERNIDGSQVARVDEFKFQKVGTNSRGRLRKGF